MGFLVEGKWNEGDDIKSLQAGKYVRAPTQFRNKITKDGSSGFPAVPGRYHLYVSYACPWANRTLITRSLKQLHDVISVTVVNPYWGKDGWTFDSPDPINHKQFLYEIYIASKSDYTGRASVPVLWDKATHQIVNNESSEIAIMLNEAFDTPGTPDLYPVPLREAIEEVNSYMYEAVNNGVYKTGFARTQEVYESNVNALFNCLDNLEERLSHHRFLVGNTFTIADVRLFVTLVRFDPVYFVHFKCSKRMISSYHNLSNYLRDIYQIPGIAETVNLEHIRIHYFKSHLFINPFGIVAETSAFDLNQRHDRDRFLREGIENGVVKGYSLIGQLAEVIVPFLLW